MSYAIMFWGNSSHSSVIFKIQKRIIIKYSYRESCRELFKELKILTLITVYILFITVHC